MGRSTKEIAAALLISDETVKTHVAHLLAKLQVENRAHAIVQALKRGIVALEELDEMLKGFRAFIERGNVLDLAVAVVIGAAFARVVTAFVEGVLMPPMGMLLGGVDFSSLFVVLDHSKGTPESLAQAKAAGIPVIAWGAFINEIITFVIVGFAVYLLVRQADRFKAPPAVTTRACPKCLTAIPLQATRCAACCADL